MLRAYDWPGNIRQLENAVFRAMVLCDGEMLAVDDFPQIRAQVEDITVVAGHASGSLDEGSPASFGARADARRRRRRAAEWPAPDEAATQGRFGVLSALDRRGNVRTLADVELEMIRLAIDHYHGQMSEVARRLGIGRSTLYRKLKEYGIDPETGRAGKRRRASRLSRVSPLRRLGKPLVYRELRGSLFANLSPWCYRISASISGD